MEDRSSKERARDRVLPTALSSAGAGLLLLSFVLSWVTIGEPLSRSVARAVGYVALAGPVLAIAGVVSAHRVRARHRVGSDPVRRRARHALVIGYVTVGIFVVALALVVLILVSPPLT